MNTAVRLSPSRRRTYRPAPARPSFRMLAGAELQRARRTRSTVVLLTVAVGIAVVMLAGRLILSTTGDALPGSETVTLSADIVGFVVLLVAAIMVAGDHQTGSIDLIRTLAPARARHLVARAIGTGVLALAAISIVVLTGLVTVLILNPASIGAGALDAIARTVLTTFLLACAGVGIGAITRSTAAATFVVIAVYWLLPIALLIAGLTGAAWATPFSEATLGILAANAIAPGAEHWAATGGVALWATALLTLGMLRETKGH